MAYDLYIHKKVRMAVPEYLVSHLAGTKAEFRSASGYIAGGAEVTDDKGHVRGVIAYFPGVSLQQVIYSLPLGATLKQLPS
jgi:hypothetical protein